MFIIKGNPQNELVQAIKAEETAQAIKAEAEAQARKTAHRRREARNRRTKQAREIREAEEEAARPNTAAQYLIFNIANGEDRRRFIEAEHEERTARKGEQAGKITELNNNTFIMLFYSDRLKIGEKNPHTREATRTGELIEDEAQIIGLRLFEPITRVIFKKGQKLISRPIGSLKQVRLTTDQAKTPQAKKYLNRHRGNPTTPTDNQTGAANQHNLISYNPVSHEDNNIIVIGTAQALKAFLRNLAVKNDPTSQYYDFIGEEEDKTSRIKRTAPQEAKLKLIGGNRSNKHRRHLLEEFKAELTEAAETGETDTLYKFLNHCLYWSYKTPSKPVLTQVRGINNLKNDEKDYLKGRRERNHFLTVKRQENTDTAAALLEEATATDGRQTAANIEHDLRNSLRSYLTAKTSIELYYLIKEVEESRKAPTAPKETNEDGSRRELTPKEKKQRTQHKKETALLNVLKSFKSTAEINEEEKDGLTEFLTDTAAQERNRPNRNKKQKNQYSNIYGVLTPNKNPLFMRKILFKSQERQAKETEKAKQEVKAEREAQRKQEPKAATFKELVQYVLNHDHTPQQNRYKKLLETAHIRHRIEEETKDYLKSFYSEKQVNKQFRLLKADHRKDFLFTPANEL